MRYIDVAAPSCAHSNAFWPPTFPWVGHGARGGLSPTAAPATLLGHLRMKQNGDDTARYGMTGNAASVVEKVAAAQLNRDGIGAIWLLHLSATQAHFEGYAHAAKLMVEIADTAERLWLARMHHGVLARHGAFAPNRLKTRLRDRGG
jgi:hypothetical protein